MYKTSCWQPILAIFTADLEHFQQLHFSSAPNEDKSSRMKPPTVAAAHKRALHHIVSGHRVIQSQRCYKAQGQKLESRSDEDSWFICGHMDRLQGLLNVWECMYGRVWFTECVSNPAEVLMSCGWFFCWRWMTPPWEIKTWSFPEPVSQYLKPATHCLKGFLINNWSLTVFHRAGLKWATFSLTPVFLSNERWLFYPG